MTQGIEPVLSALIPRLDEAVDGGAQTQVVQRVKDALQETLRSNRLNLPPRFRQTRSDTYARRLLHRDGRGRYTVVVMTWGPGQGTALHDHSGIWCVDCVIEGEMEVVQYDLVSRGEAGYAFESQSHVRAVRGTAGCLIPPFEYHTLTNARQDVPCVTLHVYGGDMTHCHVFEPAGHGTFRRVERQLSYDD